MAVKQPFCSCSYTESIDPNEKKNNPMKKKSVPKGEERCSNCQVESDERKKNPKQTTVPWLLWGRTHLKEHHICCTTAGSLGAQSHIWNTLPERDHLKPGEWHRDHTLVDKCEFKPTWEVSQWPTGWYWTIPFHKNKESSRPLVSSWS